MSTTVHRVKYPDTWDMNTLERYGALLKRYREDQRLTIADMGKRLNRSGNWYHRWETGSYKWQPEPWVLREMERVLGVPYRDQLAILGYIDPDEKEPGIAYVIREDDPRAALMAVIEGLPPEQVAELVDLFLILRAHARTTARESA